MIFASELLIRLAELVRYVVQVEGLPDQFQFKVQYNLNLENESGVLKVNGLEESILSKKVSASPNAQFVESNTVKEVTVLHK